MNQTSDILTALDGIKSLLQKISVSAGYNFSPTLHRGWLRYLMQDRQRGAVNFPLITYRPELSVPGGGRKTENNSLNDSITVVLDCAVSIKQSEDAVADLLNLLKDVRRSLVFDPFKNNLGISEIEILECQMDPPDPGDEYAFFSQKISFKVVEQYA